MADEAPSPWDSLWTALEELRSALTSSRALRVSSAGTRAEAKRIVQIYFRALRPELVSLQLDTAAIDRMMQHLLHISNGRNRRSSYVRAVRDLSRSCRDFEAQSELRRGELAAADRRIEQVAQGIEARILETLSRLLPSSGMSYKQAITDLRRESRVSYRGTALELREVLREVLDHLAPDEAVMGSEGFTLEEGRTTPTMRQKMRFILRSRGMPRNATRAPEDSISLIEEHTSSLARSTYERGSISAHVATTRREVQQLKMYVDSVLAELLEVHE